MEINMKTFSLLGYSIILLEDVSDVLSVKVPEHVTFFGFDTETNTKIDMAHRESDNIDIRHDKPFLIQFGYEGKVYVCDLRNTEDYKKAVLELFDNYCKKSQFILAHNIQFDINMLMNIGFDWKYTQTCDTMTIARLSLEAKSEREGGYSMGLKPLAARLLGSMYASAGKEVDIALANIWSERLKDLATRLKPYGITRRQINETLKDVTGTLDSYSYAVQKIWNDWETTSRVSYDEIDKALIHEYGGIDVILVLELTNLLLPIVADRKQLPVLKREMALIMPLVRMERTGYEVDRKSTRLNSSHQIRSYAV